MSDGITKLLAKLPQNGHLRAQLCSAAALETGCVRRDSIIFVMQIGRGGRLCWRRRGWDFTVAGILSTMHADTSSDLCQAAARLHPLPFRCNVNKAGARSRAAGG